MKALVVAAILIAPALAIAAPPVPGAASSSATTVSGPDGTRAPGPSGDAARGAAIDAQIDRGARSRVSMSFGLFTPTGEFGFEYTPNLAPSLELGIGAGAGYVGHQLAVMPRLRTGKGPFSVSLGAGLSGGPYRDVMACVFGQSCKPPEAYAIWTNLELGVQGTWQGGTTLRGYGGVGRLTWMDDCVGDGCSRLPGTLLPYLGIAIGHTL